VNTSHETRIHLLSRNRNGRQCDVTMQAGSLVTTNVSKRF
jgi:hypothetical protein